MSLRLRKQAKKAAYEEAFDEESPAPSKIRQWTMKWKPAKPVRTEDENIEQYLPYSQRFVRRWQKKKHEMWVNHPPKIKAKAKKAQAVLTGKDKKTGHYVRVLMIDEYPPSILVGFLDQFDADLAKKHNVFLSKTVRFAGSDVRWNRSMRNKLKRLNRNLKGVSDTDPARKAELDARNTIMDIQEATIYARRKLIEVTTFLTLTAKKLYQLDNAENDLNGWFEKNEGKLDQLRREQSEAMRQTAAVYNPDTKRSEFFTKRHKGRVLVDDKAAGFYPMTKGSFSDGEGAYFGTRTEDGSFVFLNLFDPDDPNAQNITVFGKTGSGKSFFLKALVVSLLQENVYVFVFDLTGEWEALCAYVNGVYIDQATYEGTYFEPMVIMQKLQEIDEEMVQYNRNRYMNAVEMTIRTFNLLAPLIDTEHTFEIGECIREVYEEAGIYEDQPETWDQVIPADRRPTINKVFQRLKARAFDQSYPSHQHATYFYDKVKIYFEGAYRRTFGKEELMEIGRAPLVVIRVGQGVVGSDSEKVKSQKSKQAELKLSMGIDRVNAEIARLKVEGTRFSAVLVDEGQQQLQNSMLRDEIFSWYTNIRKLNGMMILASNSPTTMLEHAQGRAMYENTSIKVFFYMINSSIRELGSQQSMPIEVQRAISNSSMDNTFMLQYTDRETKREYFDQLYMVVPDEEKEQYKTRGLKQGA